MRTSVDVHNFLVERETPHEVFSAAGRLRSPERIAKVLDLPIREVGKVVIHEGPSGPVAAVIPCDAEPLRSSVREASGQPSLERVGDDRASELTGYLAETIPPAGLPREVAIVIDRSFDRDDVLYFPGGEVRAILKIRGKDLIEATGARVARIARRGR